MEKREYRQGQFIFKVGEASDVMLLLLDGEVGIFFRNGQMMNQNFRITGNAIW